MAEYTGLSSREVSTGTGLRRGGDKCVPDGPYCVAGKGWNISGLHLVTMPSVVVTTMLTSDRLSRARCRSVVKG